MGASTMFFRFVLATAVCVTLYAQADAAPAQAQWPIRKAASLGQLPAGTFRDALAFVLIIPGARASPTGMPSASHGQPRSPNPVGTLAATGVAFSSDCQAFCVANPDEKRKVRMRYDVAGDRSVSNRRLFADVNTE